MTEIIGINIRVRREQKGWSQAHLAEAADIAERTVQRAERGKAIAPESLTAIAGALDATLDELKFDPFALFAELCGVAREELTPEMVEAKAKELEQERLAAEKEFDEKYLKVPLTRVTAPMAFGAAVGVHALQSSVISVSEEAQDIFAELRQFMIDYVDIADAIDAVAQRDLDKQAFELVGKLEAAGCAVCIGRIDERLRFRDKRLSTWTVVYVVGCPLNDVREFVAVERDRDADI